MVTASGRSRSAPRNGAGHERATLRVYIRTRDAAAAATNSVSFKTRFVPSGESGKKKIKFKKKKYFSRVFLAPGTLFHAHTVFNRRRYIYI